MWRKAPQQFFHYNVFLYMIPPGTAIHLVESLVFWFCSLEAGFLEVDKKSSLENFYLGAMNVINVVFSEYDENSLHVVFCSSFPFFVNCEPTKKWWCQDSGIQTGKPGGHIAFYTQWRFKKSRWEKDTDLSMECIGRIPNGSPFSRIPNRKRNTWKLKKFYMQKD